MIVSAQYLRMDFIMRTFFNRIYDFIIDYENEVAHKAN